MDAVAKAAHAAVHSAVDADELELLLPQLRAAREHVDAASKLLRRGQDLTPGASSPSTVAAASSSASTLQQTGPHHGDVLEIRQLGIHEFIGVPDILSAASVRSSARKVVDVLPGLRSAQMAAKDMLESISTVQSDSGPIVERIKRLHTLQLAARDTLERVQDLSDLKACLAELAEAMAHQEFEQAAMGIKQFRSLQHKLHVDESDLDFVEEAQATVRSHVQQKFDDAVASGDAGLVTHFYQLLTVLGGSVGGMASYAQFTCTSAARDLLTALGVAPSHPAVLRTIKHCTSALKHVTRSSTSAPADAPAQKAPSAESVIASIQSALLDVLGAVFGGATSNAERPPTHVMEIWQEAGSAQAVFVNALTTVLGTAVDALTAGVSLARGNMDVQGDVALTQRIAAVQPPQRAPGQPLEVPGEADPASPAVTVLLAVHLPAQLIAAAILRLCMASPACIAVTVARCLEAASPPQAILTQTKRQMGALAKHAFAKDTHESVQDAVRAAKGGAGGAMVWDSVLRGGGVCNARQADASERLVDELALILQKCTSYFRTVSGTCSELDLQAEAVLQAAASSPEFCDAGNAVAVKRSVTAQGSVRGASALLEGVGEMAALYTQLEEGALRRGMATAVALQEITQYPPVVVSTLDDMGFVVKRLMGRATATGNADAVCSMLHLTAELLAPREAPMARYGMLFPPVAAALDMEGGHGSGEGGGLDASSWGSQAAAVLSAPKDVPQWGVGSLVSSAATSDITAASLPTNASAAEVLRLLRCAWALKQELADAAADSSTSGAGTATSAMKLQLRSPQFTSPARPRGGAPPPPGGGAADTHPPAPSTPRRGTSRDAFSTPVKQADSKVGVLLQEGGLQFPASSIAAANALNTVFLAAAVGSDLVSTISGELEETFVLARSGEAPAGVPAAAVAEGAKVGAALEQLREAAAALQGATGSAVDALFAGLSPRFRGAMTVMEGRNSILRYDGGGGDMGGYDVFHGEFLGALDNIVAPYHALLEPSAGSVFLQRVCSYVCRQVSAHCRRKQFDQRGALQFDGHVRALSEYFEERGVWQARQYASALQVQAAMLLCDSAAEGERVWAQAQQAALEGGEGGVPQWATEGPPFCEGILKLRMDWGK